LNVAENKTRKTGQNVTEFLGTLVDETQRKDAKALAAMMKKAVGKPGRMWGSGMVGFGEYHYKYASGREGDIFELGFAPRKGEITLYVYLPDARREALLSGLGRHRSGKGCIYIKRLADVDHDALERLFAESVATTKSGAS
jgi:hypothetical protein